MKFFLFVMLACSFFSCNSEQQKTTIVKPTKSKTQVVKVIPNQLLVAEVEGMVCKMGCGGAIRKELITTNKVARVAVNFVEGAKKQTIKIQFDNHLISENQIVRKIESINKGQFKVTSKALQSIEKEALSSK